MNVLVDTCVWSLALRRPANQNLAVVKELRELINEQRVVMNLVFIRIKNFLLVLLLVK